MFGSFQYFHGFPLLSVYCFKQRFVKRIAIVLRAMNLSPCGSKCLHCGCRVHAYMHEYLNERMQYHAVCKDRVCPPAGLNFVSMLIDEHMPSGQIDCLAGPSTAREPSYRFFCSCSHWSTFRSLFECWVQTHMLECVAWHFQHAVVLL